MVGARRSRLGLEHVEAGAADPARLQGGEERILGHHSAARGIDYERGRLHQRKFPGADDPPGLVVERGVHGDRVHLRQHRVQVVGHGAARRLHHRAVDVGIDRVDVHAEPERPRDHPAPGAAEADHEQFAPGEVERLHRDPGRLEPAGADRSIVLAGVLRE